jgi:hypothetical protein
MSLAFVAVGLGAFLSATTLAIDVGMFMTARTQAQTAADAGALAGVTALVANSWTDRSSAGPAVQSAISAATKNKMMGSAPSVLPADVTFPDDPAGQPNRVRVTVQRTTTRGNAIPTLMGRVFGLQTINIAAVATAEAAAANAMTCVKPFMIPDKWREVGDPPWDPSDTFDKYDNHNNLLPTSQRDVYVPANQSGYTGYSVANDKGTPLVLRAGTGGNIVPSFYYSWKMPGDTGGDFYRENIENCNRSIVHWGDGIVQEPGNMSGPTIQGIVNLIAKDPGATWDASCKCVINSSYATQSPRVFPIPLYDPNFTADGKANGRAGDYRVANFLGFFADHVSGNSIYGIITNVTGLVDPNAGPAPDNLFPRAIRLVE